jgi:hypothetical protein
MSLWRESQIIYCYAVCPNDERRYAEYRYAECHYANCCGARKPSSLFWQRRRKRSLVRLTPAQASSECPS